MRIPNDLAPDFLFSIFLPSYCRRGNEPTSFAPPRRSGGRRIIENATDGIDDEMDARDADFNGTKASE